MGLYFRPKSLWKKRPKVLVGICENCIVRENMDGSDFDHRTDALDEGMGYLLYLGITEEKSVVLSAYGYDFCPEIEEITETLSLPTDAMTAKEKKTAESLRKKNKDKIRISKSEQEEIDDINYLLCYEGEIIVKKITEREKEILARYGIELGIELIIDHLAPYFNVNKDFYYYYKENPNFVALNCNADIVMNECETSLGEEYKYAVITTPERLLKIKLTDEIKGLLRTRYEIDKDLYLGRRVLLADILKVLKIEVEDIEQCECDLLKCEPNEDIWGEE